MVTSLGNQLAFNSFGFKEGNSDSSFMSFTTWNDVGWEQGWFYNQATSPFYSLTTISVGAFLFVSEDSSARHSLTVYKAENIGTDGSQIIGDWTAATIVDSVETTAIIDSVNSTSYTWTMASANYFKIQVDLLDILSGYRIYFDQINICYSC